MGYRPLRRPFPHGLLKQRYRRHEIEHPPAYAGDGFGDAQRGEGLARPAGHDQLAAVVFHEPRQHIRQGIPLMRPQAERLSAPRQRLRWIANQIRPLDGPVRKIAEPKHLTGRLQVLNGLPGVRPPRIAGIDDHAPCEWVARRRGNKGVESLLRDPSSRRMELALDGAATARALLGDQIHSRVAAHELRSPQRPFRPQPNLRELARIERVRAEVTLHQPLEEPALREQGLGFISDVVQCLLKSAVHR